MKTWMLLSAVVGILVGAGAVRAQGTTYPWVSGLTAANVTAALPLLTAEAGGALTTGKLARSGLSLQRYTVVRNGLIVARLDAMTPSRLQGVTGTALQLRQSNVRLYGLNKLKLDPALVRLALASLVTEDTLVRAKKGEDTLSVNAH